ncbi:hypothetical protein [Lentzea jiangxiensis]|nr:hypothetical protein [Lentzea jiangxiensis]
MTLDPEHAIHALPDVEPDVTRRMAQADPLLAVPGGRIARDRVSQ